MEKRRSKLLFLGALITGVMLFLYVVSDTLLEKFWTEQYTVYSIDYTKEESCQGCHQGTYGYSEYHNPELIGCTGCHLGNGASFKKEISHKDMVLIPGNLNDADKTCGQCHKEELKKIENSLMTTNSGLIAVDKYIFGESDTPNAQYHIQLLKNSASDRHLRDLCANCHLGAEKKAFGAIDQLSRGGGCNACHLNYSTEAEVALKNYKNSDKKVLPKQHPTTDIFVTNEHCFGCHSRSSRISTNYEGYYETLLGASAVIGQDDYRVLEDKRVYKYVEEDVHHEKGLLCIDCHSSHEVMGDGKQYDHEEQAVKIQCADCHFKDEPLSIPYDSLDVESLKVFLHRGYTHTDKEIISVKKGGHPLVNTYVDSIGNAFLIGKKDQTIHPLIRQPEVCSNDNVHHNLSCNTCHSSWTSKCIGCHNEYDPNEPKAFDLLDRTYGTGQWKEYVAEFSFSKPSLGVRESVEGIHIEPAVPGMILTIDKGSYKGKPLGEEVEFHRLYAPNSPHTTVSKGRTCKSCHSNPYAMGYGSGELVYNITDTMGNWVFTPAYELNSIDALPEDAWIPFLGVTSEGIKNSTRLDFRPFSIVEQKRMLTVGACLQCHSEDSTIMKKSVTEGMKPILNKLSENCILPTWD